MISISHWGLHEAPVYPLILPAGFKLSPEQRAEWDKPHGFIELIPLEKGEAQPVYLRDCA